MAFKHHYNKVVTRARTMVGFLKRQVLRQEIRAELLYSDVNRNYTVFMHLINTSMHCFITKTYTSSSTELSVLLKREMVFMVCFKGFQNQNFSKYRDGER